MGKTWRATLWRSEWNDVWDSSRDIDKDQISARTEHQVLLVLAWPTPPDIAARYKYLFLRPRPGQLGIQGAQSSLAGPACVSLLYRARDQVYLHGFLLSLKYFWLQNLSGISGFVSLPTPFATVRVRATLNSILGEGFCPGNPLGTRSWAGGSRLDLPSCMSIGLCCKSDCLCSLNSIQVN